MNKPSIFFSHSSSDKDVLLRLKDLFVEKTGGTIEVFLSSDGQSIPLGRNWVHRVQDALDEATIMVVFITPNSLRSSWIYFEAGYVYSKKIRVVPVGFLGTDLSSVAPPLSLLQGFNILNKDGLDNLIALVNETYSHNHKSIFTESEYSELVLQGDSTATHPLGKISELIEKVYIEVTESDELKCTPEEGIKRAVKILDDNGVEYKSNDNTIRGFGITISTTDGISPKPIRFMLDPALIQTTIPFAIQVLAEIRKEGVKGVSIRFDFVDQVECINESHKLTARLFGTGIKLEEGDSLDYESLVFTMSHLISFHGRGSIKQGATYLSITPEQNEFDLEKVAKLMEILFKNKVLYQQDEWFEV